MPSLLPSCIQLYKIVLPYAKDGISSYNDTEDDILTVADDDQTLIVPNVQKTNLGKSTWYQICCSSLVIIVGKLLKKVIFYFFISFL